MKILVIRFSSIGDLVLTSPVVRCLKQQVTEAEIHFLLKKEYAAVMAGNPHISKLILLDDSLAEVAKRLKQEKYDAIVDLHCNYRSFRIKRALGIKHYSFNKLNLKKWLLVNFKKNLLPPVHIVDRYLQAVAPLGVTNDGGGLEYYLSPADESVIHKIPALHRNGFIAWVVGARHNTKKLPVEKMLSIAKKISSPLVLLGGKEDAAEAEKIRLLHPEKIFNACGLFSLNESAALVKASSLVITHDTGLMHIAAAFGKRIISVWGNTVPEFGMYPYFGNAGAPANSTILEVKNLSCRPCSKIGFEKCPRSHFKCMKDIDESVFVGL